MVKFAQILWHQCQWPDFYRQEAGLLIEPPPSGLDDVAVAAIPTPPPGLPLDPTVSNRQAPASGADDVPECFAFEALGKRFQKNLRRVT
jgi:hypothetical protein